MTKADLVQVMHDVSEKETCAQCQVTSSPIWKSKVDGKYYCAYCVSKWPEGDGGTAAQDTRDRFSYYVAQGIRRFRSNDACISCGANLGQVHTPKCKEIICGTNGETVPFELSANTVHATVSTQPPNHSPEKRPDSIFTDRIGIKRYSETGACISCGMSTMPKEGFSGMFHAPECAELARVRAEKEAERKGSIPIGSSGARSSEVKPRYDLLRTGPFEKAAARRAAIGLKHGRDNWMKGDAVWIRERINHLRDHFNNLLAGDVKDEHLDAMAWNVMALCWMRDEKPGEFGKALTEETE